jgi:hypothetical protein
VTSTTPGVIAFSKVLYLIALGWELPSALVRIITALVAYQASPFAALTDSGLKIFSVSQE